MANLLVPVIIVAAVLVLVLGLMALGWRNRRRRQASLQELLAEPPLKLSEIAHRENLLYVATARTDAPLERIAVGGLAFRARASLEVDPTGVLLDVPGSDRVFIPADSIHGAGFATWTIDRVVETDGLAFIRWDLGDTEVDSSFRSDDPTALLTAIQRFIPSAFPTPADSAPQESDHA